MSTECLGWGAAWFGNESFQSPLGARPTAELSTESNLQLSFTAALLLPAKGKGDSPGCGERGQLKGQLLTALCRLFSRQWDAELPAVPCGGQTAREAEQLRGQGARQHQWLCQGQGQTGPCPPQVAQVGATLEHGGSRGGVRGSFLSPSGVCESRVSLKWLSVCAENVCDCTKSLCEFAGTNLQFIPTPGLALTASFRVFQGLPALLCTIRSAGNRPQQFPSPHA